MKLRQTTMLAIALATGTTTFAAPPAQVSASGKTLASSQLATDVLAQIVAYSKKSAGCETLDAVRMEVLARNYVPAQPAVSATSRGGHFERWTVDACGSRQQFQIGLWPSPRGGSDYAVTPLASRVPAGTNGTPPPPASPLAGWNGRYVWEEALGRIGGSSPSEGAASFVTHTLSLGPGNGPTGCTLNAEGFQTYTRMQCTATPSGNSVVIKFYRFGPDNLRGRHQMGERLLTLSRDGMGVTTQLEGLQPASDATARRGRLFKKTS